LQTTGGDATGHANFLVLTQGHITTHALRTTTYRLFLSLRLVLYFDRELL